MNNTFSFKRGNNTSVEKEKEALVSYARGVITDNIKYVENAVEIFENLNEEYHQHAEEHRRRIDFTKGIALGLLYGVIGNLFVQFFYPVVEALTIAKYDVLFFSNLTISLFSLSILLYTTINLRKQLKENEIKEVTAKERAEASGKALKSIKKQLTKMKKIIEK